MKIFKYCLLTLFCLTQSCNNDQSDWIYLFDGKTTDGWRAYNGDEIPEKWAVVDGELTFNTDFKLDLSDTEIKAFFIFLIKFFQFPTL